MKTFKVRVTGAGQARYWYANKIGQEFTVTDRNKGGYYIDGAGSRGLGGYIDKSDCVIVEGFKVGDRVRVDEGLGRGKGSATITSVAREYDFIVHHDDGDDWAYNEDELILLEDTMECTVNGVTYRQLRNITVKSLILAGAPDRMVDDVSYTGHSVMYPCSEAIPLKKICDCFSPDWLVDQGFVEVVEKVLKPCPFCGGEAYWDIMPEKWVVCKICGAETRLCQSKDEAIEVWNKRV